jgi:DNA (cytosine-5)-methyltransferase 1
VRFGSLCSGIEAATVAWNPIGWKAAWFSEIEKFPCAVLKHHYPDVPNLGDMTAADFISRAKGIGPLDLICGGTPCQAFSTAGLRKGLSDARGNLSLRFVEIAHGIKPTWIIWENVPGVLSDKGNAFGCFISALAGNDAPIRPPIDGWGGAGIVSGPVYGLAWRVLDAQYFGVPQRRRRVFVVASSRGWRAAAAVLFESKGLPRDPETGEKKGAGVAADVGFCVTERGGSGRCDPTAETPIPIAHSLRGEGFDASEDGTGRGIPLVPVPHVDTLPRMRAGANGAAPGHGARSGDSRDEYIVPCVPQSFYPTDGRFDNMPPPDMAPPVKVGSGGSSGNTPAVCYDMRGNGDGKVCPNLTGDHASRPTDYTPVIFTQNSRSEVRKIGGDGKVTGAVTSEPGAQCQNYLAFTQNQAGDVLTGAVAPAVSTNANASGRNSAKVQLGPAVRRLTPRECERLQGFPDDQTLVPFRGKPACDGPRYKAIGNSWAVPCARWIGERIELVERSGL